MRTLVSLPEVIGPYRITNLLGRGGMGEVLQGYDDRLDRPVALKRILPDAKDPEKALRRFRREAKTIAKLSHPAIVQIHDWVEEKEQRWLVMEFVAGQPLDELTAAGPLPIKTVLRLAGDIAAGLAEAHGAGIVHRDLKTSNVILTPNGRAKILDFGLAKAFLNQESGLAPVSLGANIQSTALTDEGRIVGTVGSMSPEQALGRNVDHRSDLFSLGVLLYEAMAGVAPFHGSNAVETLTLICTQKEPPLGRLVPNIPAALEELIGHLLEKEPERRPRSATEVGVVVEGLLQETENTTERSSLALNGSDPSIYSRTTIEKSLISSFPRIEERSQPARNFGFFHVVFVLMILGAALIWISTRTKTPVDPLYVAVPAVASIDGYEVAEERRLDKAAIKAGILKALLNLEGVVAIEPTSLDLDFDQLNDQARALGADEFISSTLQCDPRACQVQLRRIQSGEDAVSWTGHLTFNEESLFEVSLGVADRIRAAFPEFHQRAGSAWPLVQPADYRRFLELEQRFLVRGSSKDDDVNLEKEYDSIHANSPGLIELHQFAAGYWAQRFDETRQQADLERARKAVLAGLRIAPEDPRVLQASLGVHLVDGDLESARENIEALAAWEPGDANVLWLQARLLRAEGKLGPAYLLMRKAVERRPSWRYYSTLAVLARELGKLDEAQVHLDTMLARAPDNFHTRSMAAEFELLAGNLTRATELYEQVIERRREPTELINLGTAYLLRGRYSDAADLYREVVRQMPDSVPALLNLADAELLLGEEGAAERYQQVIGRIDSDPNPEALLANKAQALAHLGDVEGAVDTIQKALRRLPDDPATAFEAAVVYAVVGEEASAVYHARRALNSGVNAVWFDSPWFDEIRERLKQ